MNRKGFTLIELLIVIGILAILATVVVLVLNPAEILAQARDSQRISDLGSVKSALALYLATATNASVNSSTTCSAATSGCSNPFNQGGGPFNNCNGSGVPGSCLNTSSTVITGTGWVTANIQGTSGGAPLAAWPLDPTNSSTTTNGYYYAFSATSSAALGNNLFEVDGRLESLKYRAQMTTDGGQRSTCGGGPNAWNETTCWFEVGTYPGLNL